MPFELLSKLSLAWSEFNFGLALTIFFAYCVVDGMYAYYTLSVTKKNSFSAANISFIMHFILAFGVLNYVNNFLYILPLAIGSWIGTYIIVERERKLQK